MSRKSGRNPIAQDLGTDKYQQRVVKSSRRAKIDYLNRRDCEEELDSVRRFGYNGYPDEDYEFNKEIGMASKE